MTGAGSTGLILMDGLRTWSNYNVTFSLEGIGSATTLRVEILDPLNGDDRLDMADQPFYTNGLFDLEQQGWPQLRAGLFTDAQRDVCRRLRDRVRGRRHAPGRHPAVQRLQGAETARVNFGLRDAVGGRSFLIRFSFEGADSGTQSPEPASMLLLGTDWPASRASTAGAAGARRRCRSAGA